MRLPASALAKYMLQYPSPLQLSTSGSRPQTVEPGPAFFQHSGSRSGSQPASISCLRSVA